MDSHVRSRYQYSAYVPATPVPSTSAASRYITKTPREQGDYLTEPHTSSQPTTYIPRKPTRSTVDTVGTEHAESTGVTVSSEALTVEDRIYWLVPFSAVALFMVGLSAAIGHFVYFTMIDGKPVHDQEWTARYSLAIAFVFKSALVASISISLAQRAWMTVRRSRNGTLIPTIDAMFFAQSSLWKILTPSLWLSAFGTALMAACTWLMPLTALIAPTALTVGTTAITIEAQSCIVPTLDMSLEPNLTSSTTDRALWVSDYTDHTLKPSITGKRITTSVLERGVQLGWPSPCGSDCAYQLQFNGPSWQCTQMSDVDDPRAPWSDSYPKSYWYQGFYGDGSNVTVTPLALEYLLYGPIYHAGLNASTDQFWAGFAAGYARNLSFASDFLGKSLREALDVQAYACQVANTSYTLQVNFTNGHQTNTILKADPFSTIRIPAQGWHLEPTYSLPNETYLQVVPQPSRDIIGIYFPMIELLSGWIFRDPRELLVANTTLGLVPSLVEYVSLYTGYGKETPYLPLRNLGPLLQDLSYNITISLISEPTLLVTTTTAVPCTRISTVTVWKFRRLPMVGAYIAGLAVTFICLCVGGHALIINGVAYDISFSSILRTTRNEDLNILCGPRDIGALPLFKIMEEQRLRFINNDSVSLIDAKTSGTKSGFALGT